MGQQAEINPPCHIPFDPWGKRIDHIEVSSAWKQLDCISAEERLIAIGYERAYGVFSRVYQFAKIYLFHPSSAIYTCPLAMTDGAARAIELYGDEHLKSRALHHLTSADPAEFWTSGQWMTERTGGSDVSGTSTIATPCGEQFYLHGTKWFTSATTSQIAMTLARIKGSPAGSKGLSLFYLELRNQDGQLNGLCINRLKDKLGTKALPTAELTLNGTLATLIGGSGDGVKKISSLFNITRIYNACCAVGYMRRTIALARDYAYKRQAFGKTLAEHGLHLETLATLQVEFEAAFHLVFYTIEQLGKDELGQANAHDKALLRLLTPLVKLYTAKKAISVVSEGLESFGGAGYIEDTGLPKLLRDTQVLSIWEGTTNVLSLDALRAIRKENALEPFLSDIEKRLKSIKATELTEAQAKTRDALTILYRFVDELAKKNDEDQQTMARQFAFSLTETFAASLLLEHADWALLNNHDPKPAISAKRWCAKHLTQPFNLFETDRKDTKLLALDR